MGIKLGSTDGLLVGRLLGFGVENFVGFHVGAITVGESVGEILGSGDGSPSVGCSVGESLG